MVRLLSREWVVLLKKINFRKLRGKKRNLQSSSNIWRKVISRLSTVWMQKWSMLTRPWFILRRVSLRANYLSNILRRRKLGNVSQLKSVEFKRTMLFSHWSVSNSGIPWYKRKKILQFKLKIKSKMRLSFKTFNWTMKSSQNNKRN